MLKKVSFFLVVITLLQGCSKNPKVEYDYPKNQAQIDSDNVGSLMPGGGLYLVKPTGSDK